MQKIKSIPALLKTEKGFLLLDQVIFSTTSFLTTIILARGLGITEFGRYSTIVLYLYLLLSVSNALVMSPFQVLVAKEENRHNYIAALFVLQCVIIMLMAGVTLLLFRANISLIQDIKEYSLAVVFLLAGFLLQDFFRRIFLATQKAKQAFLIDGVSGVLQLAALIVTAFTHTLNLLTALLIIALTYLPSVLLAIFYSEKIITGWVSVKKYARLNLGTGKWLLSGSVLQWWANNFIVAASGIFLGIKALGALRLAQTLFGVLNALFQVLENYALPAASVLCTESADKMRGFLIHITKRGFLLLLPVLAVCILFSKKIFVLCGGTAFAGYSGVLQGMALLYLVVFAGYPVRIAIRVFLLNRDFFIAYCGSFLFSLLSAQYLIRQWQLNGVIAALIINQLLMLAYWQWVLARKQFKLWKSFM